MPALRQVSFGISLLLVLALGPPTRGQGLEKPIDRILFGSCADQDKPLPIFDVMAAQKSDLLILLGDTIYADLDKSRKVTADLIREKYQVLSKQAGWQKLRAASPILATWDDHDYGKNDAGADWALKDESQKAFLDFWEVPGDSPRRKQKGIYHAAILGPPGKRVQVILLDTRYFRSPLKRATRPDPSTASRVLPYMPNNDSAATMLGAEQWRWLEAQLKQPAEVRLLVSSIQLVSDEHPFEKWGNFPQERKKLYDLIRSTNANGVIVLSGDRHLAELSLKRGSVGYPLYDVTSSGFNQAWKAWRAPEKNQHRVSSMAYGDNFGTILIDWTVADPLITLQIRDAEGEVMIGQKFPLSLLKADATLAEGPTKSVELLPLPTGVLSADEARKRLGELVTVQFAVQGGRTVSMGKRVLLNSEKDFRKESNFTVVVENKAMTGPYAKANIDMFKGKTVRATGTVKEFNKQLEIIVEDAKNLAVVGK